ncbi:hypothetical protein ACFQ3R_07015 [Mesonia ostreae]|uniref:Anti-sigma factor n=1 Tax=Mesonia ostreae TaxID=861110 RepID=A0ABU2KLN2_9FLAO|nr:hypothetical protein [Mesonia ostreae]MDT0295642.1 hypothetical protein [Mesonia ostreae]
MELHKIVSLLEKYLEAETTLKEEKLLQDYFSSGNVDPSLEQYRPLFQFFATEKEIVLAEEEKVITLPRKLNKKKLLLTLSSIAAILVLALSVFQFSDFQKGHTVVEGNHELAMKNTQDLFNMVTGAVANSKENLMYLREIQKTKNKLIITK